MIGIIIITVFALIIGVILVNIDNEKNDSKKEEYLKRLPGYNCGACGFGSCEGMAEAMCKSVENYKKCKPLKGEKLKDMQEYLNINASK